LHEGVMTISRVEHQIYLYPHHSSFASEFVQNCSTAPHV
jgi:hypothetical protein